MEKEREGWKEQCLIIHDEITCRDRENERDWELGHTGDQRMQSAPMSCGIAPRLPCRPFFSSVTFSDVTTASWPLCPTSRLLTVNQTHMHIHVNTLNFISSSLFSPQLSPLCSLKVQQKMKISMYSPSSQSILYDLFSTVEHILCFCFLIAF